MNEANTVHRIYFNGKKFFRLRDIYKQSEMETEKEKKLYIRIKRKSISLVLPNIISKDSLKKNWTLSDLDRETEARKENLLRRQNFLEKNNVKSCKYKKTKKQYSFALRDCL